MTDDGLGEKARPDPRRHDLDALRAFAMLLGILLHAALSFTEIPWAVHDRAQAPWLVPVVAAIHGFRMPLFFLLSGFFTAMLWRRRGLRGLLGHRAKRIALPLLLGCVTVIPAMWGIVIWAGSTNVTYGATDTGRDIWTAAAYGNLEAVRAHVEGGASVDREEPIFGQSPLAWAVIGDRTEVVDYLLAAGADPSARFRDANTALHTAAFFGRAPAAERLLRAGGDVDARNVHGETPLDVLRHDRETTEYIAGLLRVSVDFEAVEAGRLRVRGMLDARGATSGLANPERGHVRPPEVAERRGTGVNPVLGALMGIPVFHHLWFLWFLCWLVAGFALVVPFLRALPRFALLRAWIASPLCLLGLVPLTMLTQAFMHAGGRIPGFGPDTSAGLLPIPHVLAHYAIFFGFGAVAYVVSGPGGRVGRSWVVMLPLAVLLFFVAFPLSVDPGWGREVAGSEATRRLLANLGQSLYAWLMVFGLMGLFETLLARERRGVRYLSDASYWLYLMHLPLVILGQAGIRGVALPAVPKLVGLIVVVTAALLAAYQGFVRYTWIGRLLNGPRTRPTARSDPATPDPGA